MPQADPSSSSPIAESGECAASSSEGRPFVFGEPWSIPGYIEAEFYDYGGEGVRSQDSLEQSGRLLMQSFNLKRYEEV